MTRGVVYPETGGFYVLRHKLDDVESDLQLKLELETKRNDMDAKEFEKLVQESVRNRKPVPDYPKPGPWFCEITALYDHSEHEWVGLVNRYRELIVRDCDKRKMLHALIDQILNMEEQPNDG